jgi:hypothetical protein
MLNRSHLDFKKSRGFAITCYTPHAALGSNSRGFHLSLPSGSVSAEQQVSNPQSQTFAGKKVSFATPQDATSFPLFAAQASLRIEYPEPSLPCPSYALAKSCLVLVTYMGPDGWYYSEIMRRYFQHQIFDTPTQIPRPEVSSRTPCNAPSLVPIV